jgi:uncharacterized protein YjbJ (UPF0337 family)
MISFKHLRSFVLPVSLAVLLATAIAFGFGSADSWAATPLTQIISQPQAQIATMNRAEAITKNIEGKAQEAIGNMTGDPKDRIMGKAKQVESQVRNAAEDVKDKTKLKGRAKAATKNIEGKVQEVRGKATGNRKDRVAGEAKQVEGQVRNAVEDVKDKVRDLLN